MPEREAVKPWTIATWNVNSIRARQERLLAWLQKAAPDVLCLQELKVTDEHFPLEAIEAAGYHAAVFGQKTYNGVAILSRSEAEDVRRGLPGFDDPQARLLSAQVDGVRVVCGYFPNGQEVGSDKWAYKLEWMRQLRSSLEKQHRPTEALVLCGDFNVARHDRDVARPAAWAESVLCHPDARQALEELLAWGLVDVFDQQHPDGGLYSWWDYRQLAFVKNNGLRLDYVVATQPLAERSVSVEIDREERRGQQPSDHAPVIARFAAARRSSP
jgi:exodeoxyribonuclease-3